jgi:hypothetical protein
MLNLISHTESILAFPYFLIKEMDSLQSLGRTSDSRRGYRHRRCARTRREYHFIT